MSIVWYIYDDDGKPVPSTDMERIEEFMTGPKKFIAQTRLSDGTTMVSTVFLGLDHRMSFIDSPGPPLVFETMVFYAWDAPRLPGKMAPDMEPDDEQWRYSTRADALVGHAKMVGLIEARLLDVAGRLGEIAAEKKKTKVD